MRRTLLISLILFAGVSCIYWQCLGHDFVDYDDRSYFVDNPFVAQGVTVPGLRWAFFESHLYWHPLTSVSYMLDSQLFGVVPGKTAFVNALLHAATALALFCALRALTGSSWRSSVVTFLFAFHPLRVESVAWIAERKDVLSGLFFALALWSYAFYARRPSWKSYGLVLLTVALGMLSKPVIVTLPAVLWLLDAWPLRRLQGGATVRGLILEKVPLLVMSALCATFTLLSSHQSAVLAEQSFARLPLLTRCSLALEAYVAYLGKILWPFELSAFYPHPALVSDYEPWGVAALASGVLLLAVTLLCLGFRKKAPYLPVGWFWFLGVLFPVIGITQSGGQFIADRFTYLPMIGLLIGLVFGVRDLLLGLPQLRRPALALVTALVAFLGVRSYLETTHWKNGETIFGRALEVTSGNYIAHSVLGGIHLRKGELGPAESELRAALEVREDLPVVHNNLGLVHARQTDLSEAALEFRRALELDRGYAEAQNNLAVTLERLGDTRGAVQHYRQSLVLEPAAPNVANNLAWLLVTSNERDLRNGEEAWALAMRCNEATGFRVPQYLETLAAACAEIEDYDNALRWQQEALGRTPPERQQTPRKRLERYRARQPLVPRP